MQESCKIKIMSQADGSADKGTCWQAEDLSSILYGIRRELTRTRCLLNATPWHIVLSAGT